MEENRIESMEMENTEIQEVEDNDVIYDDSESDKGFGLLPVAVGVLAIGTAIGVGVKKVGPKIVTWCEDRTIAKAEKIKAKRAQETEIYDEDFEEDVVIEPEVIEETE